MNIFTYLGKIPQSSRQYVYISILGCLTRVGTPAILKIGNNSASVLPLHAVGCSRQFDGGGEASASNTGDGCIVMGIEPFFSGGGKVRKHFVYEYFFTYLLTEKGSCDMIVRAWIIPCCGDADAAAEAPPRLTFSQCLAFLRG